MPTQFTLQELQAIAALIGRADIKGNEATPVAILQQKISSLLANKPTNEENNEKSSKKNG